MSTDHLAVHFQEFSKIKSSPIYATLSEFIATQPKILQAISIIPLKKSPRTVLFAAVHALLLSGIKHPLADFYPSLNGKKQLTIENRDELCADFLDFFTRYQTELQPFFLNNTQTNEPKRSMALLPAFSEIVRREQQTKLSLIEIGTSAGFLLNIDKYGYQFNNLFLGDPQAKLIFSTKWYGKSPENLKDNFIIVENKIGIDINPLDIEDASVKLWLKALIWPEQTTRMQNFDLACEILIKNKQNLIFLKGNFENYIDKILSICTDSRILCFFSVWVLYQLSKEEKNSINQKISSIAKLTKKKVYFIFDDWNFEKSLEANNIILREFDSNGNYIDCKVCQTDHHGNWINCYL